MTLFKSTEEILTSMTKEEMQSSITQAGGEYHHAHGEKKLAEILFGLQEVEVDLKPVSSEPSFTPDPVVKKPSKTKASSTNFWEDLANEVDSATKKEVAKQIDRATFISQNHNFHMMPTGEDKEGRPMRYVRGQQTLDIGEQNSSGVVLRLDMIHFKGQSQPLPYDKREGLGVLFTKDPWLKKFIRDHRDFGNNFYEYNPKAIQRENLNKRRKRDILSAGIFNASVDDLVQILSYIDLQKGRDTFETLYKLGDDRDELESRCINLVDRDMDGVLDAMKGKLPKVTFMINKAKYLGIINVNNDKTLVTWADNGTEICKSSLNENWQKSLYNYLVTAKGRNVFDAMSERTRVMFA